jgi:hypothetical protein
LKYITLACITEYIAARLVTIQILHFTGDKLKIPAVKMFVSPLRYVSLHECIDNKRFSDELSKPCGFHGGLHKKCFMRCLATLTGKELPTFRMRVVPLIAGRVILLSPEDRKNNALRKTDKRFTSQKVRQPRRLEISFLLRF